MVLKLTNSPQTIEFSMIDLFPIPNFKEIKERLFFGANLDLKWQKLLEDNF